MKTLLYNQVFLLFLFFIFGGTILAQDFNSPAEEYEFYRKKYPDEISIMLTNHREVEIRMKDGVPRVYITEIEEYLYFQPTPYSGTDEMVHFSSYSKILDIEAYTLVPEEKSYKKLSIKKFDTIDYRAPGIFHDDSRALKFNFLGVKKGAKTYVKTTQELFEPRLINSFFINLHICVESSDLVVNYPANVNIGYKLVNQGDIKINIEESTKGNKKTLAFHAKELKKIKSEDNDPGIRYYISHILVYIANFENKGKYYSVSGSINDLYYWYRELLSGVSANAGSMLAKTTDSLVNGCTDDTCRAKRIFYWVQDHVGYIAFEEGIGAFKPRSADTVFKRRYGDCKDMANLLHVMLTHAGINSYLTWIGSNDLPYSYTDYPFSSTSNHMIVTVYLGDTIYFLDATMRPISFGMPAIHIQGKEALTGIDEKNYKINKVPVIASDQNFVSDSVHMYFNEDNISGTGSCLLRNYLRHDVVNSLIEKKDQKIKIEFLNNYLSKGNNKFEIKSFDVKGEDDRDKDIVINYKYELPGYMNKIGNEYFINMNLVKFKTDKELKPDRKTPYSLRFHWKVNETIMLHIPDGYEVSAVPDDSQYESDYFGFSVKYSKQEGLIIMKHEYKEKFLNLNPELFPLWNKMIEALNDTYSKSIVLTRKTK